MLRCSTCDGPVKPGIVFFGCVGCGSSVASCVSFGLRHIFLLLSSFHHDAEKHFQELLENSRRRFAVLSADTLSLFLFPSAFSLTLV